LTTDGYGLCPFVFMANLEEIWFLRSVVREGLWGLWVWCFVKGWGIEKGEGILLEWLISGGEFDGVILQCEVGTRRQQFWAGKSVDLGAVPPLVCQTFFVVSFFCVHSQELFDVYPGANWLWSDLRLGAWIARISISGSDFSLGVQITWIRAFLCPGSSWS
jgi:hypothetical protein